MPESLELIRQRVETARDTLEAAHRELMAWVDAGYSEFPGTTEPPPEPAPGEAVFPTPLTDAGGLYGAGSNDPPPDHLAAGQAQAALVPATGAIFTVGPGMSTTAQVGDAWRAATTTTCHMTDPLLASGGKVLNSWDEPSDDGWARLLPGGVLYNQGYRGENVDVVWMMLVDGLYGGLAVASLDRVLTQIRSYLPNLKMLFVSSYNYLGYKTPPAEPACGWNDGLAVRDWVLSHLNETAPWIGWGPYFWADGSTPRSDGLVWLPEDFMEDGHHPTASGVAKHVALLEEFFQTNPLTPWFRGAEAPPPPTTETKVARPTITPDGGTFPGPVQVEVATTTEGAEIRGTQDGSAPRLSSPLIPVPLTISVSCQLRTKAFKEGLEESLAKSATFTIAA